jgi:hypothetical protein
MCQDRVLLNHAYYEYQRGHSYLNLLYQSIIPDNMANVCSLTTIVVTNYYDKGRHQRLYNLTQI